MPTGTFFRLPVEKRMRLMDAAWNEFTRVRFADTSINRIIQEAGIPRGSFYQYFEDKEDLLQYMLNEIGEYFYSLFENALKTTLGDVSASALVLYDSILSEDGKVDPTLKRFLDLMSVNPGFDLQQAVSRRPDEILKIFRRHLNMAQLKITDELHIKRLCQLHIKIVASAIMDTLSGFGDRKQSREAMKADLDILKFGILNAAQTTAGGIS